MSSEMPRPQPYRALCTGCFGQNPRCARCLGAQYVVKHPYAPGAGEQGDDFADLHREFDEARKGRELEEAGHA